MKKALIPIIILAVLAAAVVGYFLLKPDAEKPESPEVGLLDEGEEIPSLPGEIAGLDLSFSGLEEAEMPEINLDLGLETEGLDFEIAADLGEADLEGISSPGVAVPEPEIGSLTVTDFDISLAPAQGSQKQPSSQPVEPEEDPQQPAEVPEETPPAGYEPSAAECAQFESAPSCDYVPASARDICRQCKGN